MLKPLLKMSLRFVFGALVLSGAMALASDTLDFRKRYYDLAAEIRQAEQTFEDQAIQAERAFLDDLKTQYRKAEADWAELTVKAADWKKAQREVQDKRRALEKDFNQRLRIKREEAELGLGRFKRAQEDKFKSMSGEIEKDLAQFKKEPEFQKAESDLRTIREEVRTLVQQFYDKLRSRRLQDNAWK